MGADKQNTRLITSTVGDTISTRRLRAAYSCRRRSSNWKQHGSQKKDDHILYSRVFSSENEEDDSEVASPAQMSIIASTNTTRCPETGRKEKTCNSLTGVSDIFMFGSESREEQRYQEAPCSHSLPSSPPQPPCQQFPDLPTSSQCPPSSPPFPLPPVISRRHKMELENRLEVLQKQITRLESRISMDIRTIVQLLQRQMPIVPPSYSTLTLTPNTPSSSILSPTAPSPPGTPKIASLTEMSPTTNPQQWQIHENQQKLPESNSLSCGSSVLHHIASPPNTSLYQSLFYSLNLPENISTSAPSPQTLTQSSSSGLAQTATQHVSSPYPQSSPAHLSRHREA